MKHLIAAVLILVGTGAIAQERCASHEEVVSRLAGEYGEVRVTVATAGTPQQLRLVEVFANKETGTWTMVVTAPNMRACLSMAGQNFEPATEKLPPQGDPT